MPSLKELNERIKICADKKLTQIISHGILQLNDEEVDTISFVFWITYIAEQNLNETMIAAWGKMKKDLNKDDEIIKYIREKYKIKNEILDPDDPLHSSRDITFTDRVDIFQKICGKTKLTKLLWKLKDIRNDLSHGRVKELKYENQSLYLRKNKEKLILDYFDCLLENDWEKSKFWNSL